VIAAEQVEALVPHDIGDQQLVAVAVGQLQRLRIAVGGAGLVVVQVVGEHPEPERRPTAQGLGGRGLLEGLLGERGIVSVGVEAEPGTEDRAGVAELGIQECCQRAAGLVLGELADCLLRLGGPVQAPPVPVDENVGAERGGGRVGRLDGEQINGEVPASEVP
jgi:hypothetical protein